MARCGGCGAPIMWGERIDTGEAVPIEPRAEAGPGADRYLIIGSRGDRHVLEAVTPTSPVEAYSDHRRDCPDHGNGRI